MNNPVVTTYHGVQICLTESEWPGCKEIIIRAVFNPRWRPEDKDAAITQLPGIVVSDDDRRQIVELLRDGLDDENLHQWKDRIVREACARNKVALRGLFDQRVKRLPAVSRARAQAVRMLVTRFTYEEAGEHVGISDHTSVYYWIKGKGKDKYK